MLKSEELPKHLVSAEDLLHKHALVETQLGTVRAHVRALNKAAQPYMKSLHPESRLLQKRLENLNKDYDKYVVY